jgi:uncharacterized protein (TIGR04222 family)
MTPDQAALWERIEAFDIDGGDPPALRFAVRLARENSWSRAFADRAVREYKRFVFLTMTAGRPMCPSEQVDQVWHLHLTYTRSYWQRFCGDVLQGPLHHEPTRGGEAEGRKHWAMYADTLATYEETFGGPPPGDLWPSVEDRFGADLEVVRVNPRDYWMVPKPAVSWGAVAVVSLLAAAVFATGCAGNPFNEQGTDFLPYYFAAWAMAFLLGLIVRRVYHGATPNPDEPVMDLGPYEVAYLSGGRARVLTTALVRLKDMGCVDVAVDGHVIIRHVPGDPDPLEDGLFKVLAKQSGNPLDLRPLVQEIKEAEDTRFARLVEQGFLTSPGHRGMSALLPLMLTLGVIALVGLPRLVMGIANDRPSAYLGLSMFATTVLSVIVFGRLIRRTRKADEALANLSNRHTRLRTLRNDPRADVAMAVALFGATVLAGTVYAGVYDRIHKFDAAGSGGGCSTTASGCGGGGGGGCGGGDGGGGGCGGCGGGGGGD